jgi:hypothetical protein
VEWKRMRGDVFVIWNGSSIKNQGKPEAFVSFSTATRLSVNHKI